MKKNWPRTHENRGTDSKFLFRLDDWTIIWETLNQPILKYSYGISNDMTPVEMYGLGNTPKSEGAEKTHNMWKSDLIDT
jgi:hypothetical protein